MGVDLEIDSSEMKKHLKRMEKIKGGANKAMSRALNKTVTGMKTDAGKEITAMYIVKQKDIKANIKLNKASVSDLSASMTSQGRPIRLVKFKYKKNKSPGKKGKPTVYAQVRKDKGGGYTGGFLAAMRNGTTGVFIRKRGRRLPIKQLHGPGTVQMLKEKTISKNIQESAEKRFKKNLDHEVEYLLLKS